MGHESESVLEKRLEIQKVRVLRGPNIWAQFPVIEARVDVGSLNETASNMIPGFNERLKAWLPSLIEHRCSIGEPGGFFQRLEEGTYPAHILEHLTLELQSLAGSPVGFGKARETPTPGVYKVVFRYIEEDFGKECLKCARRLLLAVIDDRPFEVRAEIERLQDFAHRIFLGPSTSSIVRAAKARNVPYRRLTTNSLIQLGYGCKQRRIQAAETDRTSAIAEGIAQDKELTRKLLHAIGVPVPQGRVVDDVNEAWEAACEIGLPVVVKPRDGNQGRGVATNLSTREQIETAFEIASNIGDGVIVEKFIPGNDYRVLVVGNAAVAAARREPAQVRGDGVHSIKELVSIVNQDPKRGDHHATVLSKIKLDDVSLTVLESQGYTPDSIPTAGALVLIRRNANLSTGGTAVDVTELLHHDVAARAVEAAHMVGLEIAGIDVVAEEIARPLEEQGGVIVEVNAAPGLRMHLEPSEGEPRPVGEAIVDLLFPYGETGRIPIVAVTGVNGKTTTVRAIAHILEGTQKTVGVTTTEGIYIDSRRIEAGDCSGPQSATKVLMNPAVEVAVFETARGGILREGLAFDECDVAVVTNIASGDHLGLADIETAEDLARVKRCAVECVSEKGFAVLNAADPLVVDMAGYCQGKILFFALDESNPVLSKHRKAGGRVAFLRDGIVTLAEKSREWPLLSVLSIPITLGGRVRFHIENMLAAAGAAWCLGIPLGVVRGCLSTMSGDISNTRGRFSIIERDESMLVVDYGHNTAALQAVMRVIEKFPHSFRSAVYAAAGDRRDADILEQAEILGQCFDRVILYEDQGLRRGRPEGEIISLFRKGLGNHGNPRAKDVMEVSGALKACQTAVEQLRPGELLLLQIDSVDETIQWLESLEWV